MRYEIQSEAGDGINGTIYATETGAIEAVSRHFGEECFVSDSAGSGHPDGCGDTLTVSDCDDDVANIVTIPA
jgi:hypothetical protein